MIILFCGLLLPGLGLAQQENDARQILDAMSNQYEQIASFTADLTQQLTNENEGLDETHQGSLAVKKEMYRIKISGQEVAMDGERVYVYLEEVNEITIDYHYVEDEEVTPAIIFDLYKKGHQYTRVEDQQVNGKDCFGIDLIPQGKSQFYRIRLAIAKDDLLLQSYQMWGRSNAVYSFQMSNIQLNPILPDSMFRFDEKSFPGADIVDLTE